MASFLRKLASVFDRGLGDDQWVEPGNSVTRAVEAALTPPAVEAPPIVAEPAPQRAAPAIEASPMAPAATASEPAQEAGESTTQAA